MTFRRPDPRYFCTEIDGETVSVKIEVIDSAHKTIRQPLVDRVVAEIVDALNAYRKGKE